MNLTFSHRRDLGLGGWFVLNSPATRDRVRALAAGEDSYEHKILSKKAVEI